MKQLIHTLALLVLLSSLKAQTITNFRPKNGKERTTITITGTGFTGNVEVQFGDSEFVSATITSGMTTEIKADVPLHPTSGPDDAYSGPVKVRIDGGTPVEAPAGPPENLPDFRYVSIEGFTANTDPIEPGSVLTFTGTGFATRGNTAFLPDLTPLEAAANNFNITFNSCGTSLAQRKNAFVVNATGTVAKVNVPVCARNGNMKVFVSKNTDEGNDYEDVTFMGSDFDITVNIPTPVITSFTPSEAAVGEEISIEGTDLGATTRENEVTFEGSGVVAPTAVTKTRNVYTLTVRVPADAEDGEIKVRAFGKNALSGSTNLFTRLNHTVTTFSPTTFMSGGEVTITGTNFARDVPDPQTGTSANANQVCFETASNMNCVEASVNADGTELTATAPEVPTTETGTLKVKIGPVEVDASGTFTLDPIPSLTITDFEPKEVNLGTVVTITGTGLYHARFVTHTTSRRNLLQVSFADVKDRWRRLSTHVMVIDSAGPAGTKLKGHMTAYYRNVDTPSSLKFIQVRRCESNCTAAQDGDFIYGEHVAKGGLTATPPDPLTITGFTTSSTDPTTVSHIGEVVTITGTGFSRYATDNFVGFSDRASVTIRSSRPHDVNAEGTELKVRVPTDVPDGDQELSVFDSFLGGTRKVSADNQITIAIPTAVVNNYAPTRGDIGDELTIDGENFAVYAPFNTIIFEIPGGGAQVEVTAHWANEEGTQFKLRVPDLGQEPSFVEIKLPGGSAIEPSFIYDPNSTAHEILSFTPARGEPGSTVTIIGRNFSTTPSDNIVRFGLSAAGAADVTNATTTSLTVTVPDQSTTGPVFVVKGLLGFASEIEFGVIPKVTDLESLGSRVSITGSGFTREAADITVSFGGVASRKATFSNFTSCSVTVPNNAVTARISVTVGRSTGTSRRRFTIAGTTAAPDPPVVDSFNPVMGEAGETITITGQNFSDTPTDNSITFSGERSEVVMATTATTTSLTVTVPSNVATGPISVTVADQTGNSSTSFTVPSWENIPPPSPIVSSFNPPMGAVDDQVVITGLNFSTTPSENMVAFNNVAAATPTNVSTTSLTVRVPSSATTGPITVTVNGQTGTSSTHFTVPGTPPPSPSPIVSGFVPNMGAVGTNVTITGQHFSDTPAENTVTFGGGTVATPSVATTTSLTVQVPQNAVTGPITVTVSGQTGTSQSNFTVPGTPPPSPIVSGFVPNMGAVGTNVTITGQHFSDTPTENMVAFNNVAAAEPTNVSTTSLTVQVPSGATTGPITVTVNRQTGTSSTHFTVPGTDGGATLSVTNIRPTSASVGDMIKISGLGFSTTPSENEVVFNGDAINQTDNVETTPLVADATFLDVEVPEGAKTGPISVKIGGSIAVSGQIFTVTDGTDPSSPFSTTTSESTISVYPNPTSAELYFVNLSHNSTYIYKIYSLLGQQIERGVLQNDSSIDLSSLSEGQYVLVLQSEDSEVLRTRLLVLK